MRLVYLGVLMIFVEVTYGEFHNISFTRGEAVRGRLRTDNITERSARQTQPSS
jgi:hypothetical protein